MGDQRYAPRSDLEVREWAASRNIAPQFLDAKFPTALIALALDNRGLLDAYADFGTYLNTKLRIASRTRELVILRCSIRLQAPYEWGHHQHIGLAAGLTEAEENAIKTGAVDELSAADGAVIAACDQLVADTQLDDQTFQALSYHFDTAEILEIISVVGLYTWTAMWIKTFRVPRESALFEPSSD